MLNPQNEDEECFRWAVISALHYEEIEKANQRMSKMETYENQYNWEGLEFPVLIKMIDKFENNNPDIAVNMLFSNKKSQKKSIYTVCWSGRNIKCKKQVNLLMIVDGEERHYTVIKNISKPLSKLNGRKPKRAYHYGMNCLNGFNTESERCKHYEYCISNGNVKVNMPNEKKNG